MAELRYIGRFNVVIIVHQTDDFTLNWGSNKLIVRSLFFTPLTNYPIKKSEFCTENLASFFTHQRISKTINKWIDRLMQPKHAHGNCVRYMSFS